MREVRGEAVGSRTSLPTISITGWRSYRADICSPASPEATQAGPRQGRLHIRWSVPDRPANMWVGLQVDWPLRNTGREKEDVPGDSIVKVKAPVGVEFMPEGANNLRIVLEHTPRQ
ncbi:hypothetical protein K440DRAFT_658815 [Wilcoxina mikolae CBS 423.85]|nr:hypothetical protein K440DRAFT_658815 [Wilcoxina mikolae CBS 423.85]